MSAPAGARAQDWSDDEVLARLERLAAFARKLFAGERGTSAARRGVFGAGTTFSDVRRYISGDDPRTIDWAAFARLDELFVRIHDPEEAAPLHVVLDASASMGVEGGEKAAQAALLAAATAAVGAVALAGARVVRVPSGEEAFFSGKASLLPLLRFARRGVERGEHSLADVLRRDRARGVRAPLVLATDAAPPGALEAALASRGSRRAFVYHVVDRREYAPPQRGLVRWIDPETGAARMMMMTARLRAAYLAVLRERWREVENTVLRGRAGYLRVSADAPFDAAVLSVMQHGRATAGSAR